MLTVHISVTERGTFKRCLRQWDYTSPSRQSLGPIVPRTSLSLGTAMHSSFAQWLVEPSASFPEIFAHACAEDQQKIKAAYKLKVGANISDAELAPFHEGVRLGSAMCRNYRDHWGTALPEGFKIVYPEQKIEVPIPGSFEDVIDEHGEWINIQNYLDLRLDGFIEEISTGDLYILEHKTYSSRPAIGTLQMNDQFLAYIWGARQANIGEVVGVAYDGLWKREVPPRGKTLPDLFTRLLISRPIFEIEMFTSQIQAEVDDMVALKYALTSGDYPQRAYPNRRWEGCYDCQFETMCAMQSRGEDYEHYRNTHYIHMTADKDMDEE